MTTVEEPPVESNKAREARERHERFLAKQADKERAAQRRAEQLALLARADEQNPRRNRPHILLRTNPEQIEAVTDAMNLGILPDIYVAAGQPVVVEAPSGTVVDDDAPSRVFTIISPNRLRRLLATHTFTYQRVARNVEGERVIVDEETSPALEICKDVLATQEWPKLPPLYGIVTAPFFRPDGVLVQTPGYDEVAGLIYEPLLQLPPIPDRPNENQIKIAKEFILGDLLGDFPWVDRASKSNYVAMLFAPLVRTYLGGALVPMGAIDAKSQATGKTLLCMIVTKIYSGFTRAWIDDEPELRKAITSILLDKGGAAVVLDNVPKGTPVDSATLAAMLTMRTWSDRELGSNSAGSAVRAPNDRTWFVTGNNLSIVGDNKSRSLLSQLDAKMPEPELRPTSQFKLGDLEEWLQKADNRARVLYHLLVLMRAWIVAGANRIETPMRTFTPWASATAGLLDFIGLRDFAKNAKHMAANDPEENMWAAFYASWWRLFGGERVSASKLVDSATPDDYTHATTHDWGETFLRTKTGRMPVASGLGRMLPPEVGSWHGEFQLQGEQDSHSKVWSFWLVQRAEESAEEPAAGAAGDSGG
ncbi:hypothetical protein ACFFX1_55325 [Dactylosporangium sucinum]|uniref:Uncharacterized protein n=1 Tax=Dactylosporangium sucinum TaxID=1424081 RepID=A0A917X219_9ACTN|nr:hypothetical protein [Dactylosporangium sucinum]GGM52831.1 hypothetical protein GCM10007977_062990 [Dactylosporangium sucinum]